MKPIKLPYVFVVGNEKGGAGKTTCSMHLIAGLLEKGLSVASIDVDCRQHSLTRYLQNREAYRVSNNTTSILMPTYFLLKESSAMTIPDRENEERQSFEETLDKAKQIADVVVIDTPGSHSFLSCLAHSYADTVITPINDSFVDLDVMAKVDADGTKIISPSIYSQMIWSQKMERAKRDGHSIEWLVTRNRLSNLDAANKRNVSNALEQLAKRISFRIVSGFSERVVFKELFLKGLTLLDLTKINYDKPFSMSHVAARQELRDFLQAIGIDEIITAKEELLA
jgi:chromosome partitioning protein